MSGFINTAKRIHRTLVVLSIPACLLAVDYFRIDQYKELINNYETRGLELAVLGQTRNELHWFFYDLKSASSCGAFTQTIKRLVSCNMAIDSAVDLGGLDEVVSKQIQDAVPPLMGVKEKLERLDTLNSDDLIKKLWEMPKFSDLDSDQIRLLALIMTAEYIKSPADTTEIWEFGTDLPDVVEQTCRFILGVDLDDTAVLGKKREAGHMSADELTKHLEHETNALKNWKEMIGITLAQVSFIAVGLSTDAPLSLWLYLSLAVLMYTLVYLKVHPLADSVLFKFKRSDLQWSVIYSRSDKSGFPRALGYVYLWFPACVMLGVSIPIFVSTRLFQGSFELAELLFAILNFVFVVAGFGLAYLISLATGLLSKGVEQHEEDTKPVSPATTNG